MLLPISLTVTEILEIHADQIHRYGGTPEVRDLSLLESALAPPQASFAGEWLHSDLYEMASAYAYHLCKNHPFLDGNKRTSLATALVFLEINGIPVFDPDQRLADAILQIAQGKMTKPNFADLLRKLPRE